MAPGVCVFNREWLKDKRWSQWLAPVEDVRKAKCNLCSKVFELSNMGQRALESHASGKSHRKKVGLLNNNQPTINMLLSEPLNPNTSADGLQIESPSIALITETVVTQEIEPVQRLPTVKQAFQLQNDVARAEIIWALKLVESHQSFRSCENTAEIFQKMFPDSNIAKQLQLKKDKAAYTIVYGIAPYFKDKFMTNCLAHDFFVVCFDEALNKVSQRGQMDIWVRLWDDEVNEVHTRFLTSVYLGHATAKDLFEGLKSALPGQLMKKILQLEMDGPNVNLKVLEHVKEDMVDEPTDPVLVEMGTCGLHVFHGAFRNGSKVAGWRVEVILRAFHNLFRNSPARRADYTHYSESSEFPSRFCSTRWVESAKVAERALQVLPSIKKYVAGVVAAKKEPTCNSYITVKKEIGDVLLKAKLGFFVSVAYQLEPFLKRFQTDKPLAPFLHDEMLFVTRAVMQRVIKSSVLNAATTATSVSRLDVHNKENQKLIKDIDIGFTAKLTLKENRHNLSEVQIVGFRRDCRDFLVAVISKIQERSPLRYRLVKGLSALVPSTLVSNPAHSEVRISLALEVFVATRRISAITADKVKQEFHNFVENPVVKSAMLSYKTDDRLDTLYFNLLQDKVEYCHLFLFVKMCLVLSHGNATIESGFSVNKEMIVENLREESLMALRLAYDSLLHAGGITKFNITPSLLQYVRGASAKRREALKLRTKAKESSELARNEKKRAKRELEDLNRKKQKLLEDMNAEISKLDHQIEVVSRL